MGRRGLRNQNESKYGWLRRCLAIGIDMDAVMENDGGTRDWASEEENGMGLLIVCFYLPKRLGDSHTCLAQIFNYFQLLVRLARPPGTDVPGPLSPSASSYDPKLINTQ